MNPLIVIRPNDEPQHAFAAEGFLALCDRLHVPCPTIEEWCSFIRDRWAVNLSDLVVTPERTSAQLAAQRGVQGLTVLLADATASTHATLNGRPVAVQAGELEEHEQRYVVVDLPPGAANELVVVG